MDDRQSNTSAEPEKSAHERMSGENYHDLEEYIFRFELDKTVSER